MFEISEEIDSHKLVDAPKLKSSFMTVRILGAVEFNNNDGIIRALLRYRRKYSYIFTTHIRTSCLVNATLNVQVQGFIMKS